jgi:serine/threonine-protein kinase
MAEAHDRSSGWIGTVLADKWRIDAKIARGGVATVYRATDRQGQRAAIKIMHPELARNEEVRKRFLREGYAANKVGHPNVVSVIDDAVSDDGSAYIVMELLENGEELEVRRERLGGKLPVAEAVDICKQILDVLAVAHEKGIIHRDIKPENIFVLSDGTVKVLDFGIAHIKELAKQQEATQTGLLLGTPEYMSPEQVLGKRGQIDASTDIYAVGATLFTLLSGESVHVADSLTMLLVQAASRQARSLSSVKYKDLPRALITVVDKALALEKPRRWPSARAMQLALSEAVPSAPAVTAKAPSAKAPAKSSVPKAKLAAPPPRPASLPPPRGPSMPPAPARPASLPPAPARPSLKAQPVRKTEPLDGPASVPTLTNAPATQPSGKAGSESIPPPSLPPISGPTTVIPRHGSDPWTDEMGADDLDGPTVATSGPIGGAPAPSVRSEVLARPPMPSAPSTPRPLPAADDLESTQLLRTDERMALAQAQTTPDLSGSLPPPPPKPSPREAPGRSFAPPGMPAPSVPPPWMAPRGHTMPMMNDHVPQPRAAQAREPLAPALIVVIVVAALLLSAIWIGTCSLLQAS